MAIAVLQTKAIRQIGGDVVLAAGDMDRRSPRASTERHDARIETNDYRCRGQEIKSSVRVDDQTASHVADPQVVSI